MFYESIGALLGQAAESLAADDPDLPVDERSQRARRQIIVLLGRISVIWPQLFQALDEESAILEATRHSAVEAARAHGLELPDACETDEIADPLARYRQLLRALDELVILLHEHGRASWAQDALRSLRRGLADAAEVQGQLVDDMLAARVGRAS